MNEAPKSNLLWWVIPGVLAEMPMPFLLIFQGETTETAIRRVRAVEPVAIETPRQIQFLEQFAERVGR
jgi:hypothetical protein